MKSLPLLVALLAGCGGTETTEPATTTDAAATDDATKMAEIAVEIRANPDGFEAILTKHGMTAAEYEHKLYLIAEDPDLSATYEARLGTP